jgi:hypothetical protein
MGKRINVNGAAKVAGQYSHAIIANRFHFVLARDRRIP